MSSLIEIYTPIVFVVIVGLTFHEFAHAWVAYKLGDNTAYDDGRVSLNPLVHLDPMGTLCIIVTKGFGWARPVPVNPNNLKHPRRDDFLITAAGPFSNLLLAILSGMLLFVFVKHGVLSLAPTTPMGKLWLGVLSMGVRINLILMIFNLIPLFPLDGSHIVKSMLPPEQAYSFSEFNESYGPMILLGVVLMDMSGALPILSVILHPPIDFLQSVIMKTAAFVF